MSKHLPESLAARRAALLQQCAEQRDQLALQAHSLRAPLAGGPAGMASSAWSRIKDSASSALGGAIGSVKNSAASGKLKVPLLVAGVVTGALVARRIQRRGQATPLARQRRSLLAKVKSMSATAKSLSASAKSLWATAQPLLAMLRR